MRQSQQGFTLVELMVAMVIGTVIILGAGQLFLTTFQTFKTVDNVSRKQEALIFATSMLTEAGRKGELENYATVTDERNEGSGTRYYCVLQDEYQSQPIVDLAQVDSASDCPPLFDGNSEDVSRSVTMRVGDCREDANASCDEITFTISDRNKIISSKGEAP
jgi:prepilin-type N-terminal cleavage/methylation domain-containing protein